MIVWTVHVSNPRDVLEEVLGAPFFSVVTFRAPPPTALAFVRPESVLHQRKDNFCGPVRTCRHDWSQHLPDACVIEGLSRLHVAPKPALAHELSAPPPPLPAPPPLLASWDANCPPWHAVHESSVVFVPVANPFPSEHGVFECGAHVEGLILSTARNVSGGQLAHAVSRATVPWTNICPAVHVRVVCVVQGGARYSPSVQLEQTVSVVGVPGTSRSPDAAVHVGVACGWHCSGDQGDSLYVPLPQSSHALSVVVVPAVRPLPGPQAVNVYGEHGLLSFTAEYCPAVHVSHLASSAAAVPAVKPRPGPQEVIVCGEHGLLSFNAEYCPPTHASHLASSAVVVPGVRPRPTSQEVVVCGEHGLLSFNAEYWPPTHALHTASSAVVVPGVRPRPRSH